MVFVMMSKYFTFIVFLFLMPTILHSQNHEICGDGIDNDSDGQIDEVCVPFECDGSLYQSAQSGSDFILYKVRANPVQFIPISNLTQNGVTGSFNSLAYNPVDNFMYGMGTNDPKIYRIDANGDVEFLGNVSGLTDFKNAGTFDDVGNYYVFGDERLRKIDIVNLTYVNIGGVGTYGSADIVFNPLDNHLYGWSGSPKLLFKMNPNTGAQTKIPGNAPLAINSWGWVGALYFNAQGDILGYQGTSMIKINPTTGVGLTAGNGPSKSGNDGCSCSFGVEMTKSATGTFQAGDTITYHFEFFNQSFYPILTPMAFDDVLNSGFKWASNPYDITNTQLSGNTNLIGTNAAHFTIDNLPKGKSSFSIDVVIPCNYNNNTYTNQASLANLPAPLKDTIWSDNPITTTIGDATTITLSTPPLNLNLTPTNIICERSTGTIQLQATGGAQPLSYQWSNGQTGLLATGLVVGNYIVTITGSTGCVVTVSEDIIEQNINLNLSLNPQNVQCNGEANGSVEIDTTIGGFAPYRYALNNGSYSVDNQIFEDLAAGTYTVHVKDSFGCVGERSFTIIEPVFRLELIAPKDTSILLGEKFVGRVEQNTLTHVEYQWFPTAGLSCSNCQSPIIQAPETTTYTVFGMDISGCYDSVSFEVKVNDDIRVFIPNAFSPNEDGKNDILNIYSPGDVAQVKSFRIFDRWGEMVFEQTNFPPNHPAYGWDGRFAGELLNTGVFLYAAELLMIDGRVEIVTGDVTLIR